MVESWYGAEVMAGLTIKGAAKRGRIVPSVQYTIGEHAGTRESVRIQVAEAMLRVYKIEIGASAFLEQLKRNTKK